MNFDFIQKVIEYISDLKIPDRQFVFSMTTNGLLVNKYIDFLAEKNVQLLISLDGNRDNHSYRVDHAGKNSFDKVVKNIEIIKQRYPKYYNDKVNFNAVLHNRNAVEDIFSFIKKEFGKAPMISELNPTGLKKEKVELFWQTYKNKTESIESSDNYLKLQKEMFLETPRTRELALFIYKYSGNVFNTYNDLLIDNLEVNRTNEENPSLAFMNQMKKIKEDDNPIIVLMKIKKSLP